MKLILPHLMLIVTCFPLVIVEGHQTAECIRLAESADCSFYTECVERNMPCGPSGYAVGYGYHFCNAFEDFSGTFTKQVIVIRPGEGRGARTKWRISGTLNQWKIARS